MHGEYVRLVPDADTAVLFIHGICGTPNHFREPIPLQEAVPEVLSVYNVLLDGHGALQPILPEHPGRSGMNRSDLRMTGWPDATTGSILSVTPWELFSRFSWRLIILKK